MKCKICKKQVKRKGNQYCSRRCYYRAYKGKKDLLIKDFKKRVRELNLKRYKNNISIVSLARHINAPYPNVLRTLHNDRLYLTDNAISRLEKALIEILDNI